jgi:hypothetical protein
LINAGINTFIDSSELPKGEQIASELLLPIQPIQGSRISVVVFSNNYVDSSWCLEVLAKIMECRRTARQLVLPIFYDVDSSDVRHQKGNFAEVFAKHEERYSLEIDKVLRWKRALFEVANLSGWHLRNNGQRYRQLFYIFNFTAEKFMHI